MSLSSSPAYEKLLKICLTALGSDLQAGELIAEEKITETARSFAAIISKSADSEEVQSVIAELTRRFNIWTGPCGVLTGDDPSHKAWLPVRVKEVEWRFWNRYRLFLETRLPPKVVTELSDMTDTVLGLLEDPTRAGGWRRQGLVVGHVQSGKTGNYTGLLCKAADAGYKVIVVLSGIHNSLRAQTQIRLDEGFLGYARQWNDPATTRVPVGVGEIDPTLIADSVTTRDDRGDFNTAKAQGFQIHAGGNVLLFVVKKNVRVLKNLIDWAKLSAKKPIGDGRFVVGEVPLLVIDDEADQASVDTRVQAFDEETGQPDLDHSPTAINHLIRTLLETFERRAYVGYTATPFANVFIHPEGKTPEGGEDLFPRHFIINLSAPSNYFGPARIFGRGDETLPRQGERPSRIRFIKDASEWIPPSHKNGLVPRYKDTDVLPPSLEEAIRAFVLSSAARRARGQITDHKSMLIHVTRFTAVQGVVHRQVSEYVNSLKDRWRTRNTTTGETIGHDLREMWDTDFAQTSTAHGESAMSWEAVESEVWSVLELIRVNLINAKASDALIYEEHKKSGLHVIAVGGDKLSRGLTLEGLSVSYFLRAARMYDTLMQMGRWFGYRPNYEDLCRLYLSSELAEWYGHITDAAEELRQEFDRMVLLGGTPDDYGIRVRTHPVLAITGKLRPGLPSLTTSLSATPFEPTILLERSAVVRRNWELTLNFVNSRGAPSEFPVFRDDPDKAYRRGRWPGAIEWDGVSGAAVLPYLKSFEFAERDLSRTPAIAVRNYIEDRIANGELTEWSVVVLGKGAASSVAASSDAFPSLPIALSGCRISTIYRDRITPAAERKERYVVKRLGSPKDESIDLSVDEWRRVARDLACLRDDPQRPPELTRGRLLREGRPKTRGLLILYLLSPDPSQWDRAEGEIVPLVAPFVSFPHSADANPVSYTLNYRYWEDELAGVE
ncbi:MAG: Z1 domain-containing protein [Gemmatimonadaceae bacterium]|nr:Z1 domain-containing protein [Gemmatimonadaceae bacterium]